ncbi:MAG: glycosyltransferase [Pseudomonadota bacterium]|nr:glycosyltransferase [Pseudomonadota bacterium]
MADDPIDVVLVTIGSAGDLFPFLRIGTVLRDLGHRVSFIAPWLHQPYVEQAGLPFHGVDIDEAVLDDPDLWHAIRGFGVVWRATRPAMAQVQALATPLLTTPRSLLIVHPLALPEADLIRASRPGVTVVAGLLAPQNLPTVHDPLMAGPYTVPAWIPRSVRTLMWRTLEKCVLDPVALPGINAARSAQGLAPVAGLLQHLASAPDLSMLLFPAWFAPPQPDWPRPLLQADFALYDPNPTAALSTGLRDFLAAGPAPLVFTHGTGNRQAAAYFAAARDAAVHLQRRAIFLTPHAGQVPPHLPPTILWQDYVPLRALLPHVGALIHHGGIGTTAEALRAGTPQLVVPMSHDQFDNAERVKTLKVGARLDAARLNTGRLVAALAGLFSRPDLAERCREVAARADDGAAFAQACKQLLHAAAA